MPDLSEEIEYNDHLCAILNMYAGHERVCSTPACDRAPKSPPSLVWAHNEQYRIVYANHAFWHIYRPVYESTCYQLLHGRRKPCRCCRSAAQCRRGGTSRCAICKRGDKGFDLNVYHTTVTDLKGAPFNLKSATFIKPEKPDER